MFDPAIATQTYGMRAVSMRKGHSLAQTAREVHVKIIGLRAHACQDEPDGEKKSAFPNLDAHCKKKWQCPCSSPQRRARGRCCPHEAAQRSPKALSRASAEVLGLAPVAPRAALSELKHEVEMRPPGVVVYRNEDAATRQARPQVVADLTASKQRRPRAVSCRFTARWDTAREKR